MQKFTLITVGVFIFVAGMSAFLFWVKERGAYHATDAQQNAYPARPLSPFSLYDFAGNIVTQETFKNRIVVVNIWASWCPFCRRELADFSRIHEEFKDHVTILAVNRGETEVVARRYASEIVPQSNIIFLLDPDDSFYKSIQGFSMPETLFVDTRGIIRAHRRGQISEDEMRRHLRALIEDAKI
ncbi:MAG: alkyl hydroperoxide reductase/thiol specific antioxidant/Mal allergen [Parcubacteria group bacterium Gr01-1014_66]|nr:MAG: alkyl hydroperoxide reductase/thiol specific antioxidant/Mal allergen [Parcubacteria group bacterium Gr01-1014_66]